MGKKVKKVAGTVGRGVSGVFTLGGSEIARNNLSKKNVINQVLQAPGHIFTGGMSMAGAGGSGAEGDPAGYDYTNFNQLLNDTRAQGGIDQAAINAMGKEATTGAAATNADALKLRKDRRAELATLLSQQADNEFKLSQPEIAEESNSAGILYSSGYGNALAKEKGRISTARDLQLAQQALTDTDADIAGRQQVDALGRVYKDSGLSRNFSLQDFAREGAVAKEIGGASAAPKTAAYTGGGKGGALSGGASGAAAGASFGPYGALIGGGAGALLGSQSGRGK